MSNTGRIYRGKSGDSTDPIIISLSFSVCLLKSYIFCYSSVARRQLMEIANGGITDACHMFLQCQSERMERFIEVPAFLWPYDSTPSPLSLPFGGLDGDK